MKKKVAKKVKKIAPRFSDISAENFSRKSNLAEEYKSSIKVFGKIYLAQGSTLAEAISRLKPEGLARGLSIITIKKGEQSQEKILPKLITGRLFSPSPTMREAALKQVAGRFSL